MRKNKSISPLRRKNKHLRTRKHRSLPDKNNETLKPEFNRSKMSSYAKQVYMRRVLNLEFSANLKKMTGEIQNGVIFKDFEDFSKVWKGDVNMISSISNGANGMTFLIKAANIYDMALLKVPVMRFASKPDNLVYEHFIGSYINTHYLNRFPSFVATYGMMKLKGDYMSNVAKLTNRAIGTKRNLEVHRSRSIATINKLKDKAKVLSRNPGNEKELEDIDKAIKDKENALEIYKMNLFNDKSFKEVFEPFELSSAEKYVDACVNSSLICLLTQYIKRAMTFRDFMTSNISMPFSRDPIASFEKLHYGYLMLYQLIGTLSSLRGKFVHYDLHMNNVLVTDVNDEKGNNNYVVINYRFTTITGKKEIVSVKTPYIAKIIDYGRCYVPMSKTFADNASSDEVMRLFNARSSIKMDKSNVDKLCGYNFREPDANQYFSAPLHNNYSHDLRVFFSFRKIADGLCDSIYNDIYHNVNTHAELDNDTKADEMTMILRVLNKLDMSFFSNMDDQEDIGERTFISRSKSRESPIMRRLDKAEGKIPRNRDKSVISRIFSSKKKSPDEGEIIIRNIADAFYAMSKNMMRPEFIEVNEVLFRSRNGVVVGVMDIYLDEERPMTVSLLSPGSVV